MRHSTLYCTAVVLIGVVSAFHMIERSDRYQTTPYDRHYRLDIEPVRYDDAQLWRIFNISDFMRNDYPLSLTLEHEFGAVILDENEFYLDVCVHKESLKAVRRFLDQNYIANVVVRHENVQELIDAEQTAGRRTKRQAGRAESSSSMIAFDRYHDLDTIYSFMDNMCQKHSKICSMVTIGKTVQDKDLKVMRITTNLQKNKKIWILGGILANEWASQEAVIYVINDFLTNWAEKKRFIKTTTWYLMPVFNPDGFIFSKADRFWVKNVAATYQGSCRGVNLNFNFETDWICTGSTDACSARYHGALPFSEKETNSLKNFINGDGGEIWAFLNFRNIGQKITFPWGYKTKPLDDEEELQLLGEIAAKRIHAKTTSNYTVSRLEKTIFDYEAHAIDWARDVLKVKFVYEISLRGSNESTVDFIVPENEILPAAQEGLIVAEAVAGAILRGLK